MSTDLLRLISLDGQTALVTGGSRGIGRSVSLLLARAGAYVVVNYRGGREAAVETLDLMARDGGAGQIMQFDVVDSSAVDAGVSQIVKERGKIDILVNNAGISKDGLLGRMKDADWNDVINTNVSGSFHMCRAVSRAMIRNRRGRIISIASTAGEAGNPGQVNYSASKAALIGLTKALARELAPRNILVNAVSPGLIRGGMSDELTQDQLDAIKGHVPLRRLGETDEVAAAALFLCSEMSNYITGQVIRVNGGLYV
jgi:3-oxoacyl-[acyl-carrier protein] reductase